MVIGNNIGNTVNKTAAAGYVPKGAIEEEG
jgi:hypothetical protein